MKAANSVQFKADSLDILNLLIRYRTIVVITALATVAVSAALTYTITPLFRSTVVLYPTTNVVESQPLLGVQVSATPLFGDETATEKVLQILKSDIIKEFLVEKYNLMDHYGINPDSKYSYSMLDGMMSKYIVARKTQFNSVEISVLDSEPEIAAAIANDIAGQIDTVFNIIVKDAGKKSWDALLNIYNMQLEKVRHLEDSLNSSNLNKNQPFTVISRAGAGRDSWAASAGVLTPGLLKLMNMYESENENLSSIGSRLTGARMLGWEDLPYTHIINRAKVSERKALPKRSIIVLATTASVLLLLIFILGLKDSIVRNGKAL